MSDPLQQLPVPDVSTRRIYAYRLNLAEFEGRIKVGETARSVRDRVKEQVNTAGLSDVVEILMDEPAIDVNGRSFRDHDVHAELRRMGVGSHTEGGGVEWFTCSLEQVKSAYNGVYTGQTYTKPRDQKFGLRDEQAQAVDMADAYFSRAVVEGREPRFLWNAKMRFGKTFAAYHLAKRRHAKRVLVVTYKPAVEDSWRSDLDTHIDFEGWVFASQTLANDSTTISSETPLVCFSSLHDLRGRDDEGGIKGHNQWIHHTEWDLVVVDEYHYGAWNESTRELFSGEAGGGASEYAAALGEGGENNISISFAEQFKGIEGKAYLCLSGTPFRAIASNEFSGDQIFNWTYTDEQRAKEDFAAEHPGEWNPYGALPQMRLLTYQMPDALRAVATEGKRNEFDLSSFFAATGQGKNASFVYKDHVQGWLDWLRGQDIDSALRAMEGGNAKPFPYSDTRILAYMNHSVWFLPTVASVFAMRNLLAETHNQRYWNQFDVLAVAGTGIGTGVDALPPVRKAIGNGYDTKTITLTCGKLLTGVTVPQWSAILMLTNLAAPESYFQAAFRVQSPWSSWNPGGHDPNEEKVRKPACLVLDFAPSRALRLFADHGMRLGKGHDADADVRELLYFLPVLGFEGTTMAPVALERIIDTAFQTTTVDTRQMHSRRFIAPDVAKLAALSEETQRALTRVTKKSQHDQSAGSPVAEINETPELKDVDRASGKREEKESETDAEELSEGELAERLQFLSMRINAFMYLSDEVEKNLYDVLSTDEAELFRIVMGLDRSDMAALVDAGLFNEQAMRLAIHQFRRADYESFGYTGLDPRSVDKVGESE